MGRAEAIRSLNDRFRQTLQGGRALVTRGVLTRGDAFAQRAIAAVQTFFAFTPDNDPHGEHDFGAVEIDGVRVFFKIDLYEDPSVKAADGSSVVTRVLTIFLAEEY